MEAPYLLFETTDNKFKALEARENTYRPHADHELLDKQYEHRKVGRRDNW